MWNIDTDPSAPDYWKKLRSLALSLVQGEKDLIANLANLSSLFYHAMPSLNWAGFYLWKPADGELVLGPFQGKPACIRIRPERGVCGAAYRTQTNQRVDDVHAFPGHIACDSASRSELVIPLVQSGVCVGVLDLDSPDIARFSPQDEAEVSALMHELMPLLKF